MNCISAQGSAAQLASMAKVGGNAYCFTWLREIQFLERQLCCATTPGPRTWGRAKSIPWETSGCQLGAAGAASALGEAGGQMEYQRAPPPQYRCGMTCGVNSSPDCGTVLITLTSFHLFSALLITKERICFYIKAESLLLPSIESHFISRTFWINPLVSLCSIRQARI